MSEEEKPPLKLVNELGNENPWYVLMTIAGEQGERSFNHKLHEKNRRYWNGWATQNMSEEEKENIIQQHKERWLSQVRSKEGEEKFFYEKIAIREEIAMKISITPLTKGEKEKIEKEIKRRYPHGNMPFPKNEVSFSNTKFDFSFSCKGFVFPSAIFFRKATFSSSAHFRDAVFLSQAHFTSATFLSSSQFSNVIFSFYADFVGATFSLLACFDYATFLSSAYFDSATFSNNADFGDAEFLDKVVFNNSKFENTTNFKNAKFNGSPPLFYNADLHEDTDWTGVEWPEAPKKEGATDYLRAYERLRLIMAQQNKFHDEHLFLRKELRCRETESENKLEVLFLPFSKTKSQNKLIRYFMCVREVIIKQEILLIIYPYFFSCFYRKVSNYGWSITQPLMTILNIWLVGGLLIGAIEYFGGKCLGFWEGAGLSFSNIFGFLGFGNYFFADTLKCLSPFSKFISGAQTFVGFIFLFLLFLSLRNHFRIK